MIETDYLTKHFRVNQPGEMDTLKTIQLNKGVSDEDLRSLSSGACRDRCRRCIGQNDLVSIRKLFLEFLFRAT